MTAPVQSLGTTQVVRPQDTFAAPPDASGRQIVETHTSGRHADVPAMANDLKRAVTERPSEGASLLKEALDHVSADERGELAGRFLGRFSNPELQALQGSAEGRDTLEVALAALGQAGVSPAVAQDAQRVGKALGIGVEVEHVAARRTAAPENTVRADKQDPQASHQTAQTLISEARRRIPKAADYLDYIEYLRNHQPAKLQGVLTELQRTDPKTWLALQKHPQFQPLGKALVGANAGEKNLGATAGLIGNMVNGQFGGTAERWMESALKDMMKRDRFGAYADVLGDKATTLATKEPWYSSSKLGQFFKVDDAERAVLSKAARAGLERSVAAVRDAVASSLSRVGGVVLNFEMEMLKAENGHNVGVIGLSRKADRLHREGAIDEIQWAQCRQLLSQGKYVEMQQLMDDATRRFIRGTVP